MTSRTRGFDSELRFATALARSAGDIMLRHFKIGVLAELKADESPVTVADRQINRMVIETVKTAYPSHGVLGEEESAAGRGEFLWVCDPIDGTNAYRWGVPTNVFSLALVHDGVPILGVVFDPYLDRMYVGRRGAGATMNGEAMRVNGDHSLVAGRFACTGPVPRAPELGLDVWGLRSDLERSSGRPLVSTNSCVYEAMLVASGQISAGVFPGTNAQDRAAAKVIVEEAGGQFTDLNGRPQRYDGPVNGGVASNGVVHAELLEMIARHQ